MAPHRQMYKRVKWQYCNDVEETVESKEDVVFGLWCRPEVRRQDTSINRVRVVSHGTFEMAIAYYHSSKICARLGMSKASIMKNNLWMAHLGDYEGTSWKCRCACYSAHQLNLVGVPGRLVSSRCLTRTSTSVGKIELREGSIQSITLHITNTMAGYVVDVAPNMDRQESSALRRARLAFNGC